MVTTSGAVTLCSAICARSTTLCGERFATAAVKYIRQEVTWSWLDPQSRPPRRYWHVAVSICATCLAPEPKPLGPYRWYDSAAPCPGCGHPMRTQYRPGPAQKVCSAACAQKLYRARRKVTEATCATCGEVFAPTRRDAVYCSSPCRQRAYRRRAA